MSAKSFVVAAVLMAVACVPAMAGGGVPFLNQGFSPTSAAPGSAAFTLTVTGSGFTQGAKVFWNSHGRTTTRIDGNHLTVAILASDIATGSTARITVKNPAPAGGTSNTRYFSIQKSSGTITLMKEQKYPVSNGAVGLVAGDLVHGRAADVVTANSTDNTVSVLIGNTSRGGLGVRLDEATAANPMAVAIGDLNGDGFTDIVSAGGEPGNGTISILLGLGSTNFLPHVDYPTDIKVGSVALGDLNRDGALDILACPVSYPNPIGCRVFLGKGDGTFGPSTAVAGTAGLYGAQIGDFNGDGILDFAAPNFANGSVSYAFGNGDGTFGTVQNAAITGPAAAITLADMNGDGNLDIAVVDQLSGQACYQTLLGDGKGGFTVLSPKLTNFSLFPNTVLAYDFNGDGKLDVMIDDSSGFEPNNFGLGAGDGRISSFRQLTGAETAVSPIAFGDFNFDGLMDVVALTGGQYPTLKLFYQATPLAKH